MIATAVMIKISLITASSHELICLHVSAQAGVGV
jgi:hypothetical protein